MLASPGQDGDVVAREEADLGLGLALPPVVLGLVEHRDDVALGQGQLARLERGVGVEHAGAHRHRVLDVLDPGGSGRIRARVRVGIQG